MATWVGIFVSTLAGKSVRKLEVEADNEEEAIVLLDCYDYDKTWQHYSLVELYKKRSHIVEVRVNQIKSRLYQLFGLLLGIRWNLDRHK